MAQSSGGWKNLVKYGVAVTLLGLMIGLNWSGLQKLFSQTPHLGPFFLAVGIFVICTITQYYRWYLLVRALHLPFTLRNAFRLGLVGTFYNTFLPGSIGGDFVKAFFIAQGHPDRRAAAVATVFADRLFGLFGLLLFAGTVGGAFWAMGDEKIASNAKLQGVVTVCGILAGVATVSYVALGFLPLRRAHRFGDRLASLPKVGPTFQELWYTVWTYRQRPGTVLAAVGLSAIVHTGFVLIFFLAIQVFPPADPVLLATLPEVFVVAPIGYIVQALIPLPGGLGGGELTFGGLYDLIRPGAADIGLAGRLTMRLVEWSIGLMGYLAYLRMRDELPIAAAEEAETSGALNPTHHTVSI
ncbi:MAG: flippase-like domain-containing protein [Bacteroidales bacterium]|nr:flippase-like domain-containing protein [Bacteroidales bacterium]